MHTLGDARSFARCQGHATLTASERSVRHVPIAFTAEGHPLVPGVALASPAGAEVHLVLEHAGSRLTLWGDASIDDTPRLSAIHPPLNGVVLRLRPLGIRWVPADGPEQEITPEQWLLPEPEWKAGEEGITAHMNADHVDAMQRLCRVHHGIDPKAPALVAVDPEGLLMRADERLLHVAFDAPSYTHDEVHQATVRLARAARTEEARVSR